MRRLAVVLLVAAALIGGCRGSSGPSCCRTVDIGGESWELLLADRDGMRGMSSFQGADGMLFDFDQDIDPMAVVFVMDGVAFPLDIAWFTDSGELVGTASMAVCPAKPCPTYAAPGPYRWAIEAPPGAFADLLPSDRLDVSRWIDGTASDIIKHDMGDSVPFQLQLTRAQHRRLKRLAESRGVSMGSILRESVADYLTGVPVDEDPAFGIIGLIDDDGPTPHGDPATQHDAYLADALDAEGLVVERPSR